jgi:hypothetical protein
MGRIIRKEDVERVPQLMKDHDCPIDSSHGEERAFEIIVERDCHTLYERSTG